MKKIIFLLSFIFMSYVYCADYETTNYRLVVPSEDSVSWSSKISNDFISVDNILYMISDDMNSSPKTIVSRDSITSVGGAVGRMRLVSSDGTFCYVVLYAPN